MERAEQKFDRVLVINISANSSGGVLRWGRKPSEAELTPRRYSSFDGGEVEVTLRQVATRSEFNETLTSYRFRDVSIEEVQPEYAIGSSTFTKPYTAFMGATRVFGCLNIRGLHFSPLDPPYPDLAIDRDGRIIYLEVTQVRREAELFELYREIEKRSRDQISIVPGLASIFTDRSICVTFIRSPKTRGCDRFIAGLLAWLSQQDLVNRSQIEVTDTWLRKYVRVVSVRRPNLDRPISFARHGNVPARIDAVDAFSSVLKKKIATRYMGTPLWLAVTILDEPDALMLRLRAIDFDIGNFEKVFVTDEQDVLTMSRI